jgi:predicted nucleotidyltransferase
MIGPKQLATIIKQHLNESLNNIVSDVVIFGSRVKGAGNIKSRITRMINNNDRGLLIKYRLDQAIQTIGEVSKLIELDLLNVAVNRIYLP